MSQPVVIIELGLGSNRTRWRPLVVDELLTLTIGENNVSAAHNARHLTEAA